MSEGQLQGREPFEDVWGRIGKLAGEISLIRNEIFLINGMIPHPQPPPRSLERSSRET